jgi:GNAT superfamily N-acetyltransferase
MYDPSPKRLIGAFEENLFAWIPVLGRMGQVYLDNPPGVRRSITDIPMSLLNSVMDARLAVNQVDETIQAVIADARPRKVPLLWWLSPSTRPADLGKHLERHGFKLDEESPGMAVHLAEIEESQSMPEGLSIHLAQDDASWLEWSGAMAAGFEIPASADFVVETWHDLLRKADHDTVQAFTGRLKGKPVATSLLFLAGGVAGIYSVGTIPDARGKGIGRTMAQHALYQARSLGYDIGVLQASEMGFNVYRSLGFLEVCRISSYRWRPETA